MTDNPTISSFIKTWFEHIRVLSVEIGARGSTTLGERKAAKYCFSVLLKLRLNPKLESFSSARSIFHPHLIASLGMLAAFGIYPLGGRIFAGISALLSIIILVSELQELGFYDNLLRRMVPKGMSQNVLAMVPSEGEHVQDLILIGHMDTQRTPLIFSTYRMVEAYKKFTTAAFVTFAIQSLLYFLGVFIQLNWIWFATIPTAICALLLAAICIEAENSPFTAGANDNASAVGLVLTLAEQIAKKPLKHTRLICVCTGCEEVQHYGAIHFFQNHRAELLRPKALVFELLGCAGPGWLMREGIVVPFYSDPDLVKLVQELSTQHPEWGAYPVNISGGNSELADCVRYRVPALTLFGLTRNGQAPHWHQPGDTIDKINLSVLENTRLLTWEMILELDRRAE
jgi:hypothetical protein